MSRVAKPTVEDVKEKVETPIKTETAAINKVEFQRTIYRLLDLDKLAIIQSHTSRDEKEELIYVLDNFCSYLHGGDKEKIWLSYQIYYYALRNYKKIKTNLKDITEILIEKNILV